MSNVPRPRILKVVTICFAVPCGLAGTESVLIGDEGVGAVDVEE